VAERWFTDDELREMARPTMERAIEAIDRGEPEAAKSLCEAMKSESQFMHDLLVDGVAGLISFVKERLRDEGVEEAWTYSLERSWRKPVETIAGSDRRAITAALAATWRAHSTSGGQRLWRNRRYGPDGWGVTDEAHSWSYGREGFPLYCTHCAFLNEALPIRWIGYPVYPSDPPDDFDRDPCTWYWYKDPAEIPERHFARHGLEQPDGDG
jgi:DNA-binding transcriptional ArsR family regulator